MREAEEERVDREQGSAGRREGERRREENVREGKREGERGQERATKACPMQVGLFAQYHVRRCGFSILSKQTFRLSLTGSNPEPLERSEKHQGRKWREAEQQRQRQTDIGSTTTERGGTGCQPAPST